MNRTNQSGSDSAAGINAIARAIRDLTEVLSAAASITEGSFTGTLTGMSGATTGTVEYIVVEDSAGAGKLCTLRLPTVITGTSNTTAMTMTGIPAACTPQAAVTLTCEIVDNSGSFLGLLTIAAAATTIVFHTDQPATSTGFTNSGTKGLSTGWTITYRL